MIVASRAGQTVDRLSRMVRQSEMVLEDHPGFPIAGIDGPPRWRQEPDLMVLAPRVVSR